VVNFRTAENCRSRIAASRRSKARQRTVAAITIAHCTLQQQTIVRCGSASNSNYSATLQRSLQI